MEKDRKVNDIEGDGRKMMELCGGSRHLQRDAGQGLFGDAV